MADARQYERFTLTILVLVLLAIAIAELTQVITKFMAVIYAVVIIAGTVGFLGAYRMDMGLLGSFLAMGTVLLFVVVGWLIYASLTHHTGAHTLTWPIVLSSLMIISLIIAFDMRKHTAGYESINNPSLLPR